MIQTLILPSNPLCLLKFSDYNRAISLTSSISDGRRPSINCRATISGADHAVMSRNPAAATASLYEVLQVSHNASPVEIKKAYRRLAKLYHPDALKSGESDGRDFIEIHKAHETLSDPAARALYDLSLGVGRRGTLRSSASPFGGGFGRCGNRFYPTRRWETDQCW